MTGTLIRNNDTLNKYLTGADNLDVDTFSSYILEAQIEYIQPLLDDDLMDELIMAVDAHEADPDNSPLPANLAALLPYVQRPVAYYALLLSVPVMQMQIGDAGVSETTSDMMKPARQWVAQNGEQSLRRSADVFGENLLAFLERNKADYPTWVASNAYTELTGSLIKNRKELSKWITFSGHRKTLLALKPFLAMAEKEYIESELRKALFARIKAGLLSGTDTQATELAEYCRPVVAYRATHDALPHLHIQMTSRGFRVADNFNENQSRAAKNSELDKLRTEYAKKADHYTACLFAWLEENKADFPEYVTEGYDEDGQYELPDNPDDVNTFIL